MLVISLFLFIFSASPAFAGIIPIFPPTLTASPETGYAGDIIGMGVEPNIGTTGATIFTFKVVYTQSQNRAPFELNLVATDGTTTLTHAMSPDVGASDSTLRDGNYTNGEQYIDSSFFAPALWHYHFESDFGAQLPASGEWDFAVTDDVEPSPGLPTLSFASDTPSGLYEDDGIQDHKGTAGKTHFTFSIIYTDAQNRAPENFAVDVLASSTATTTILAAHPDLSNASSTLRDGDYRNGEAYIATSTFSKDSYTYFFTVTVSSTTVRIPSTDNLFFETGYSNILFLPGIEASRLYVRDLDCTLINCENQLWEPNRPLDVSKLYLDTSGSSTLNNVYTRDAIDTLLHGMGGDIYKTFLTQLRGMATTSLIADYKILPYDWRMDPHDMVSRGVQYSDGTHFMIDDIQALASTSDTGKVTIVGHSNGGLVAKVLVDALTHVGKDSLVDKMIFVASPQLGTPETIGALLHGDEQAHFPIISQANARGLAENMKSAYNLLPSQTYFDRVGDSVANFSRTLNLNCPFQLCSSNITDRPQLEWFLEGGPVGRVDPAQSDVETPNVLSSTLLASSTSFHDTYDTWQPPSGIETIQIAGWGIDTVKGLEYWTVTCKWYDLGCTEGQTLIRHAGTTTMEGDGTVIWPSAMGQNNGSRYYVYLASSTDIQHSNITEFAPFQQLFSKLVTNSHDALPKFVTTGKPEPTTDDRRLRMRVLSPVSLDVYDSHGLHTGLASTSGDGVSDFVRIDEEIPGSYYREFGEGKYIGLPATGIQRVVLKGLGAGTFTFEVSEIVADRDIHTVSYKDIPTSSSTVGVLLVDSSHVASTSLSLDLDGNGSVDTIFTPSTNPTDPITYIHLMETSVQTMAFTKETKKLLLKKLTHIERLIKKDTTMDSDDNEKEQEEESSKEKIFSNIDRFEQLVRQLATDTNPKKRALTIDQAIVLTDIADALRGMI